MIELKYNPLTQLFKTKVENIEQVKEIPSSLKNHNRTTTGNEESNKISSWYNRLLNREPEVIIEDETPIYKNKYVITAAILILLGLSYWSFKDSIDPVISDTIEKLQIFRSGANRDTTTICKDVIRPIEETNKSWWKGLTDKVKSWWSKDNKPKPDSTSSSDISLQDMKKYFKTEDAWPSTDLKGKGIDLSNLSEWERTRRILDQLSGNTKDQFDRESSAILGQVNTFIIKHENNTLPKDVNFVQGLFTAINASLNKLNATSSVLWNELLKDEAINNMVNKFQKEIPQEIEIPIGEELTKLENENAQL